MRPLRLTIQALGPYSDRQVIDFRDAVNAGLFGIYGSTGSGKSTIFSAMTFALFGEAAKSEQDAPSLRSDHADPSLTTEVEFVFDIGERRFVVVRRPDQVRPKLRGEGETISKHEAFLFDATGMALDEINAEQRGKIIEEKKVRTVDLAIEDLLGYGSEQFRQIVLLPQGRFEIFLSAKTKERLNILRDLFDVSLYRKLTEKLKADAEIVERRVREERELCTRRLASEGFESTDALTAGISDSAEKLTDLKKKEALARTVLTGAQKALHDAQILEGKFKAAEDAQEALTKLQESKGSMDELAAQVKKAEKAQLLLDRESALTEATNSVAAAGQKLETARSADANAKEVAASATEVLKQEEKRSSEIDDLAKQLDDLKRYKETLERAAALNKGVEEAVAAEKDASTKLQEAQTRVNEHQNKRQEKADALKTARTTEAQRTSINSHLTKLKSAFSAAEAYEKAQSKISTSEESLETLTSALELAQGAELKAQEEFEMAENNLSEAQALHLASKLSDGDPCPVCGATDHPSPATGTVEQAGLDKAFREAKASLEKATAAVRKAEQEVAGATSKLDVHKKALADLSKPEEPAADIRAQIESEESALEDLGPETDISAAETEIDRLSEEIIGLEAERDRLREDHSNKQQSTASASARLEEMLEAVPEELRDPDALSEKTDDTANTLDERKNAKQAAEKAATDAREKAIVTGEELKAATTALSECTERRKQAEDAFKSRLEKAGLTQEEFVRFKQAIESIDDDRETIEEYLRNLKNAEEAAKTKADEIRELVRPDLEEIESKQDEAQGNLDNATDLRAAAEQALSHLTGLRDELAETLRTLEEEEKTSGPLRSLAALTNGDNPYKLDLETFAIGTMFDQVLEAANLRLGPMTANRYQLERDIEGGGRGRRGLGIQVFDLHTGKTRPTATLSGGETFIAALALALGLADIVESASGKVRLDTIFIDEGFGSLDTENGAGTLDQVLNVLNTLVSQNRSVGLISHVPLVQEAVPNGFYVRKDLTGSAIEIRGAE
jgi:DNA repair protein SbcC/Rad50